MTSIITALVFVFVLTACGSGDGGGPSDLNLGGPTSGPVTTTASTTTTTTPSGQPERTQVARARFAQLAVYDAPDAAQPTQVLRNPWRPKGAPREQIPQVLLVETQQGDGWVKVKLPDEPQPTSGWVRSFDVKLSPVTYRVRVTLARHRVVVFNNDRRIFQSPIRVTDAQEAGVEPGGFWLRRKEPARANEMTASPYTYRFIASLVRRVPLGSPVEIVP